MAIGSRYIVSRTFVDLVPFFVNGPITRHILQGKVGRIHDYIVFKQVFSSGTTSFGEQG